MKKLLIVLALAGCSSGPSRPTVWTNLGWARVSVAQAKAECEFEAGRIAPTPGYHPIAAALESMGHVQACMKAKGWEER